MEEWVEVEWWRFFSFIEFCSTSQTCVLHLGLKSGLKCCYGGPNSDVIKHIFIVIFDDQVLIKIKVSFFVKLIMFIVCFDELLFDEISWPSPGSLHARRYLQDQQHERYGICPPDQLLSRRLYYRTTFVHSGSMCVWFFSVSHPGSRCDKDDGHLHRRRRQWCLKILEVKDYFGKPLWPQFVWYFIQNQSWDLCYHTCF